MRILIATVTAGGGDLAAAAAMQEGWSALRPTDTGEKLGIIQFFGGVHRESHEDGYVRLVEHAPELWGMMFKETDDPKLAQRMNRLKRVFPSKSRARFVNYVKQFGPEVVLCTHYLPLEVLEGMRDS